MDEDGAPRGAGVFGTALKLSDNDFREIRDLVYRQFGIHLTEQKRALVVGRLQKVLRSRNMNTFAEYLEYVRGDETGQALSELVNRISTNHTYFWRESDHFVFFRDVALPEAMETCRRMGERDLRIWCAGCSTGEEPYTLVMLMREVLGSDYRNWKAGILATDISERALSVAMAGRYDRERVQSLPAQLREKYFRPQNDGTYLVDDTVRGEVTYRRFNLMTPSFPFRKPFHLIFCRNVMIYFDQPTRRALVDRFHKVTIPGGYFFIGHSESLGRENCPYGYVRPATYRKAFA